MAIEECREVQSSAALLQQNRVLTVRTVCTVESKMEIEMDISARWKTALGSTRIILLASFLWGSE